MCVSYRSVIAMVPAHAHGWNSSCSVLPADRQMRQTRSLVLPAVL
jgi:hypothetical protein